MIYILKFKCFLVIFLIFFFRSVKYFFYINVWSKTTWKYFSKIFSCLWNYNRLWKICENNHWERQTDASIKESFSFIPLLVPPKLLLKFVTHFSMILCARCFQRVRIFILLFLFTLENFKKIWFVLIQQVKHFVWLLCTSQWH